MSDANPISTRDATPTPEEQLENYEVGTPLPDNLPPELKELWGERLDFLDRQRGSHGYKHPR